MIVHILRNQRCINHRIIIEINRCYTYMGICVLKTEKDTVTNEMYTELTNQTHCRRNKKTSHIIESIIIVV